MRSNTTEPQKLGANEQALIDNIGIPALRNVATTLLYIKMYFQFTGWLQYMLPLIAVFIFFSVAAITSLFGLAWVATPLTFIGSFLLIWAVFDIITVKFRLRFPEHLPERNEHWDTFDLMRARRSCRSFQTRKLTPSDYDELMQSIQCHSEAVKIGQSPVRFEYISAPLTVWPTVNASEFIVSIAPKKYERLAVIDVGRSLQKIVIDATRMGLATCWIGPGADQSSILGHLGDSFNTEEDHIICVCAIGYKSWYIPMFLRIFNRQFLQRLPISSLFFTDSQFKEPLDVDSSPFKQFGRNYEVCQWSPSSYNGQTTRCVAVVEPRIEKEEQDETRTIRFDFYANTASRYYAAVAVGIWCANWEMGCNEMGIRGHFEAPPVPEEDVQAPKKLLQLPRYDVSWVLDKND